MFRFTMPENCPDLQEIKNNLQAQFQSFAESEPLKELYALLGCDARSFRTAFNGRRLSDGRVIETHAIKPLNELEPYRQALYPLLKELCFFDINTPLRPVNKRVLILGGSLNACFLRTKYAANRCLEGAVSVDGLTCFRPIDPTERNASCFKSGAETEFGAMSDVFMNIFDLFASAENDRFSGDRNLNRVSCIRTFDAPAKNRLFRIYAAPSSEPELRRADTGDTLLFYLKNNEILPEETLLAVSHNCYCNRQFIQLACRLLEENNPFRLDVVGYLTDEEIVTSDTYDPLEYLQELISLLNWIDLFQRRFCG